MSAAAISLLPGFVTPDYLKRRALQVVQRFPAYRAHRDRIDAMIDVACQIVGEASPIVITRATIMGDGRGAPLPHIRWAVWVAMRDVWGWSYPQIAAKFNRDHTTVMHGDRRARELMKANPNGSFSLLVEAMREMAE